MIRSLKLPATFAVLAALFAAGCGQVSAPTRVGGPVGSSSFNEALDERPEGAELEEAAQGTADVVPDQLIVAVKPGTRVVLAADDMMAVRSFDMGLRYQVVQVPSGMRREEAIQRLQKRPGVQMVAPNRLYSASMTPNDPMFSQQWGHVRTDAKAAWDKHVDASNVTVAVLDTGVDYNHPDLKGRVILGPDLADADSDPMDTHGHGTHVAGIIGASGNNAQGVAGVAWNCKIMAVRVLGSRGNGSTDSVMQGIKYAADHGAKVINMSLGTSDPSIDPVLHLAMQYAANKGCTIVAAAGNNHGQVGSPANDPYAIAVSSTSNFWKLEFLSTFSNRGDKVEVSAPGGAIYSLLPTKGAQLGSMYGKLSGTSMAAPYVAGEAALIIAQHPNWAPQQVRARITSAVDDKGDAGRDPKFGFGRVNLAKALD